MSLRDLLHELVHEIGELKARIKVIERHLEALAVRLPWLNDFERFMASVYRPPLLSSAVGRCRALLLVANSLAIRVGRRGNIPEGSSKRGDGKFVAYFPVAH